jgi:hypothetical protein
MKILGLFLVLSLAACATPAEPSSPTAEIKAALKPTDLNGIWDVEMFYSPTEPPSTTVMELTAGESGALSGSFYQSEFEEAEYSLRGSALAFGAVTSDGSAPYSHSGRLVDGKIEGQTLSHGRDFLMIWVATRREEAAPVPE